MGDGAGGGRMTPRKRPRAGRPELEPGAGKAPTISVRVPASVRAVLATRAAASGVSLSDYARDVLTHHARDRLDP